MDELWQLYDTDALPVGDRGATKDEVFRKGLLHGSANVWIYVKSATAREVALQRRSANKRTWPHLYDISAAGHINFGETPLMAAIRETNEEVGLDLGESDLRLIHVYHGQMDAGNGDIENEYEWVYLFETKSKPTFSLQESEVAAMEWVTLDEFKHLSQHEADRFVPHGSAYYKMVADAIGSA